MKRGKTKVRARPVIWPERVMGMYEFGSTNGVFVGPLRVN